MRAIFANSLDYWTQPQFALDAAAELQRRWHGLIIIIETPQYGLRSGDGWMNAAPAPYGYIAGTTGADGEEVDCYLGPDLKSDRVYIVDQNQMAQPAIFDEHKVMLGYPTRREAKQDYLDGHMDGEKIFRAISRVTVDELKRWLKQGDARQPYSANL
jgi:hypothetical protein